MAKKKHTAVVNSIHRV